MAMNATFFSALDALCAQHGLTRSISRGNVVITDLAAKSDEGVQSLKFYGRSFGLEESDHGAQFEIGGKRFKLVGLKPSRPKYPLLGECIAGPTAGTVYKIPRSVIPQIQAGRATRVTTPTPTASAPVTMTPPAPAAHNPYADIASF